MEPSGSFALFFIPPHRVWKSLAILIILFFFHPLHAQPPFLLIKGSPAEEEAVQLEPVSGGYGILYNTQGGAYGDWDIVLERWNASLEIRDSVLLGGAGLDKGYHFSTLGKQIVLVGESENAAVSSSSRQYAVFLDWNGIISWQRSLSVWPNAVNVSVFYRSLFWQDTLFAIGSARSESAGFGRSNQTFAALNPVTGNLHYEVNYDHTSRTDIFSVIHPYVNGNLYCMGFSATAPGASNPYYPNLVIFGPGGTRMGAYLFNGSRGQPADLLTMGSDSLTLLLRKLPSVGFTPFHNLIARMNSTGNVGWARSFEGSSGALIDLQDMEAYQDKFIFVGTLSNDLASIGGKDLILISTDTLGQLLWSKVYGASGDEEGVDVVFTGDGFFVLGTTTSFGNGDKDLVFMKTDLNGDIGNSNTCFSAFNYSPSLSTQPLSRLTSFPLTGNTPSDTTHNLSTDSLPSSFSAISCNVLALPGMVEDPAGSPAHAQPFGIQVSPNPFQEVLQLNINLPEAAILEVSLLDLYGREVYHNSLAVPQGISGLTLDGLGCVAGYYLLRIWCNVLGERQFKVIKN